MKKREQLLERSDLFGFEHKPSEVNYGGSVHFHQVAFPAAAGEAGFEEVVYQALLKFTSLLQGSPTALRPNFSWQDRMLAEIFFDQWAETPRLSAEAFQNWYCREVAAVIAAYVRMLGNALEQERTSEVPRLCYFVTLATVILISDMILEFYEKQIESLGKLANTARLTLGRCFCLAFQAALGREEVRRLCRERLGSADFSPDCRRLINPLILAFGDASDAGLIEEMLCGPNPYRMSNKTRTRLSALLGQLLVKSKRFEAKNVKRALAEPTNILHLFETYGERMRWLKALRVQTELRVQMVGENVFSRLRSALLQLACAAPEPEVLSLLANERQLAEVFLRPYLRNKLKKHLRRKKMPEAEEAKKILAEGGRLLRRSQRRFFGRLTKAELARESEEALRRLGGFLAEAEDFRLLRARYGRDTNQLRDWQGLKIWRTHEIIYHAKSETEQASMGLQKVWEAHRGEVENAFAEGNMFFCRPAGEIYPSPQQRRRRTIFLFADLRNSTETTMKLTKDTASFLTPYLTAVDSESSGCGGERIYFAGDGYAAHYQRAADAVRAAYRIAGRFAKLRGISLEEHRRKAKEIFQQARALNCSLLKPGAVQKYLQSEAAKPLNAELHDLLTDLSLYQEQQINEETLTRAVVKVSAAYSMPRVDVGIALTSGELFFALVGEEGKTKIPIVISPALTQAARLSGSSEVVKLHIEEHLPQPLLFNVYAWDKKLYNRGIVVTEGLFDELQHEVEMKSLATSEKSLAQEKIFYYFDQQLNRKILVRELSEPVSLKGIEKPCHIYEIAIPAAFLDKIAHTVQEKARV